MLKAVAEFDRIGRQSFLHRYGFGQARSYLLREGTREYDSKAIVGVAHGYARPDLGPLDSQTIFGGVSGAAGLLGRLGFTVDGIASSLRPRARQDFGRIDAAPAGGLQPDLVLLGCVKSKLDVPAPAEELYVSPLFRKRRAYAEFLGQPWFVLSALHGLLAPSDVVEPYDMALSAQGVQFRRAWGQRAATQLREACDLNGKVVEIHAGSAYVDALEPLLQADGANVQVPLRGLNQGQHLAWYSALRKGVTQQTAPVVTDLVTALADPAAARGCADFPWGRVDLEAPGLYSWWVDDAGAHNLTAGLGQRVAPGIVYAGQAGADSARVGKASDATLRSRIGRNHLAGGIDSSTWRRTLQSVLAAPSPAQLTSWMHAHLALIAVPVSDRSRLQIAEKAVLELLDPPLNLMGMSESATRRALRELRRQL